MIHHGFIAPINYLHLIPEDVTFHLLLAHLLSDKTYSEFYRKRKEAGDFIIIDNGAFEFKKPLAVDEYYKLVNDSGIEPDVIVAPDYPFEDWKKTVDSTLSSVKTYDKYFDPNATSIMAVPQSKKGDHLGWIRAYSEFSIIEEIDFIGMSILGIPNAFCSLTGTEAITFNRTFASLYLLHYGIINEDKRHHYLGCEEPRELMLANEIGVAWSNDSSTAFWHAINGILFDSSSSGLKGGKISKPVDFHIDYDESVVGYINSNIATIRKMISNT